MKRIVYRKDSHHALVIKIIDGKYLKGLLLMAPNVKRGGGLWPSRLTLKEYREYDFIVVVFSDLFFAVTPVGKDAESNQFSWGGNRVEEFTRLVNTRNMPAVRLDINGVNYREEPLALFCKENLACIAKGSSMMKDRGW